MPFNGSGSFSLIFNWQQDALNNINISSSRMMGQENDIAAGLSLCLTKDGQQIPTANIPMGGFRLTNMGNATAQGNAVSVQDVQNGSVVTLTSVAGTDTITANTAPLIGSYAAGQSFRFVAAGANTTTAVTLNINGLGAKNVTKLGANALAIGDIPAAGAVVEVTYDGTQFQIARIVPIGGYLGTQIIDTSQTVNPGTYNGVKARMWRVRGAGAGGAGGGAAATAAGSVSVGTGAQSGAYAEFYMPAASTSATVGAGGTAGAPGAGGGTGGTSTFGANASIPGGVGGGVAGPAAAPFSQVTGGASGAPTGTATFVVAKAGSLLGTPIQVAANAALISGAGGAHDLGTGGNPTTGSAGGLGTGRGAGGSGAANGPSTAATAGGAGLQGRFIVDEFS